MRQVIGFTGYKQVGKSTLAREFVSQGWTLLSFADGVRDLLLAIDPEVSVPVSPWKGTPDHCHLSTLVDEYGWDYTKVVSPDTRRLLQVVGTEVGRSIDERVWVNKLANRFHKLPADAKVVIDDVRMVNECDWIKHVANGQVIRLRRDGVVLSDAHTSETTIDHLDVNHELHLVDDAILNRMAVEALIR